MIYYSVKYCCSNSSIPGVILHCIMKSIKTPNHPAYHWSTLWPLEVWVRGLYNSWWYFAFISYLCLFIYLWLCHNVASFWENILIFKDWTHKKIFIKGRGFRGGSDKKMRIMWLRLRFVVVGLPSLLSLHSNLQTDRFHVFSKKKANLHTLYTIKKTVPEPEISKSIVERNLRVSFLGS